MDIHDIHNIEITSNYDLVTTPLYSEMETYLYFPKSLGLTEVPVFSILGDVQVRMRLSSRNREKRARLLVEQHLTTLENHASPDHPEKLSEKEIRETFMAIGSLLGDWFTYNRMFVRKRLAMYDEENKNFAYLHRIFQISRTGLELLDKNVSRLRKLRKTSAFENSEELKLIDEYLSQRYLVYLDSVSNGLSRIDESVLEPKFKEELADFRNLLSRILRKEAQEAPPDLRAPHAHATDLETKLVRFGYLKKYFQSAGFVELFNSTTRERMVEPIAIFAGALAGLLAALAVIATWIIGTDPTSEKAVFTIIIFLMSVYIVRDRLKEHSKTYLTKKLSSVIPNRKSDLRFRGKKIGQLKTWVEVNPKKLETPDVAEERKKASIFAVDQMVPEDLLVVRRSFLFDAMADKKKDPRPHLHDIVRINLQRYLKYMHQPETSMTVVTPEGGIEKIATQRRYILFLVVVVKVRTEESEIHRSIKTFRLHLTKEGIQRLELVRKARDQYVPKTTLKSMVMTRF